MDGKKISYILLKKRGKIITSEDIKEIFGEDYIKIISKLINTKWLMPLKLFKGSYYLLNSEEKTYNRIDTNNFEILTEVLNKKFEEWYFGRSTALYLLGIKRVYSNTIHIINKKISKTYHSNLFGNVVFTKINASYSKCGLIKKKYKNSTIRISNRERTAMDYIYLYLRGKIEEKSLMYYWGMIEIKDMNKALSIANCYKEKEKIKEVVKWLKK